MTTSPAPEDRTAVALDLADRLFAAIASNDLDALRNEIYAPDVVVWHNNDNHEQRIDENLKVLNWLSRKVTNRRYEEIRRQATDTGFVEQHVLRGTAPSGKELEIPACLVVTVTGGRIDEYIDSAALAAMAG
jgi:uncharacterized protein